jgi:hypothetical protein
MHNTHIANSIPELVPEIKQQLEKCKSKLDQYGRPRDSKAAQLDCMVNLASEYHKLSIYALDGHYDKLPKKSEVKVRKIIQDSLERFQKKMLERFLRDFPSETFELTSRIDVDWHSEILDDQNYREIYDVINDNRGKESPGEVNPCVLGILWEERTKDWTEAANNVTDELIRSISIAVGSIFNTVCLDEDLRQKTQQWLSESLVRVSQSAEKELTRLLSDERNGLIWTLNPRRTNRIHKLSQKRIAHMIDQLIRFEFAGTAEDKVEGAIKLWLGRRKDISAVFDTYDRLASYYEIAMYRFIDNFGHQVVERHLLGPESPLRIFEPGHVVRTLQEDGVLLQKLAGENEIKIAERAALSAEKVSLERALTKAREYGFYGN